MSLVHGAEYVFIKPSHPHKSLLSMAACVLNVGFSVFTFSGLYFFLQSVDAWKMEHINTSIQMVSNGFGSGSGTLATFSLSKLHMLSYIRKGDLWLTVWVKGINHRQ